MLISRYTLLVTFDCGFATSAEAPTELKMHLFLRKEDLRGERDDDDRENKPFDDEDSDVLEGNKDFSTLTEEVEEGPRK